MRNDQSTRMLQSAWIASMDRPLLRDGAVLFAGGWIIAVGPAKQLRRAHPEATVEDLGASILLPGLVNAHTHLELSLCEPMPERPAHFVDWVLSLRGRARLSHEHDVAASARAAVRRGVAQSLRFGVTSIGDISRLIEHTRPELAQAPLRAVSYGEVLAPAAVHDMAAAQIEAAADRSTETNRLRIGITPHAPYTVEPDGYSACLATARERNLPLATHLAEQREEAAYLAERTGPFREILELLGSWTDGLPTFSGGPIRYARSLGLLDYPTLLAHVNYCDDDDLALLAGGRASVVYCPRTHAYFGHPPHRWRDMLTAGVNVAVGTDSCASSPDLNLVEDLRLLHRLAPEVPAQVLWEMATTRAARAIGQHQTVGALRPGMAADFTRFDARTDDPLKAVLESDLLPRQVWIDGNRHASGSPAGEEVNTV